MRTIARPRPATLQLLAGALVGAVAVVAGLGFLERESRMHGQTLVQLADIRSQLARIDDEAAGIPDNTERYRQMAASGLVGPERRLEWVESIAQIKAARRLFEIRYEFSPQRALEWNDGTGGAEFMSSTMKLRMDLLHENDLLGFLDDLASSVPALLQVRACSLERLTPEPGSGGTSAQLGAECTIDWVTLKEPG